MIVRYFRYNKILILNIIVLQKTLKGKTEKFSPNFLYIAKSLTLFSPKKIPYI